MMEYAADTQGRFYVKDLFVAPWDGTVIECWRGPFKELPVDPEPAKETPNE